MQRRLLWIPYRMILFLAIIWWYAGDMVSGTEAALRFTTYGLSLTSRRDDGFESVVSSEVTG